MELRGHLDLLLLATLQRLGGAHGYAVIATVRQLSGGAFDLAEGTVYPALHRLERGGALTSAVHPASGRPATPGRRRVYRLTHAGEAMLAEQRRQWQAVVQDVAAVVGPPSSPRPS